MTERSSRDKILRRVLIAVLILGLLVIAGAAVTLLPILMHQSAGGSGQKLPSDYVSRVEARGADGRERVLEALTPDGEPADLSRLRSGDELVLRGTGYDAAIGIYISICAVPENPESKPSPCLGGLPEGAMAGEAAGHTSAASSYWITNDWAWRLFASGEYAADGSFEVHLIVPDARQEGLDCSKVPCAIATRADHTAARDRVQDMLLPVSFVE